MTTPLERATQGVKAEMIKQFGKHAEYSQRPIHYATAALDAAPDRDQLIDTLMRHRACRDIVDGSVHCSCGIVLPDPKIDPLWQEAAVVHMADVFIAYLQQGIEQAQPNLTVVAA